MISFSPSNLILKNLVTLASGAAKNSLIVKKINEKPLSLKMY